MSIQIHDNTFWVGKVDNRDVPFHRLILTKGTTYNSYLIKSEKPTIIDTVDISFGKEFRDNLEKEINLEEIQYIVINHTEPDHSGGLRTLAAKAVNAVIVCTQAAVYELKEMYKLHDRTFLVVKTGDTLDIGGKTLSFIETPYLHTEETMVTYCVEDKTLFSCDIFSTHVANEHYFNDKESNDILEDFKTYYTLIMHPHRMYVREMIEKIKGLDIALIAPSHGYLLREDVQKFIQIYDDMSRNVETSRKGLVLYSSMTGNTREIASEIKELYEANGIEMNVIDVNRTELDAVVSEINKADIVFFGTSTRYADMIGNMESVLKKLETIDLEGKYAVAFGSYGWSGEPIEIIQDYLNQSGFTTLNTSQIVKSTGMTDVYFPIRIRFSLNEESRTGFKRAVYHTLDLMMAE
ncbi:FprA family A-type flavoprotein [Oceanispirochaeta crateris]|uniref:FprA family A-type flavoprotein n=1 Tax=Oceanispirochaeta crateris TaxID=2518645 RepID=A0A5C1QHX4_9SPIO|nr:FprA family A-type flavoprotein [Oceanispirochaeta crateris]QEN07733.1 FprA family A-type flavoprotein [Oceanispirochaeta crateris]